MGAETREGARPFNSTLSDDGVQLSGQLRPDVFDVITAGRRADVTSTPSNAARSAAPEAAAAVMRAQPRVPCDDSAA